jgi:hypothetical protein
MKRFLYFYENRVCVIKANVETGDCVRMVPEDIAKQRQTARQYETCHKLSFWKAASSQPNQNDFWPISRASARKYYATGEVPPRKKTK